MVLRNSLNFIIKIFKNTFRQIRKFYLYSNYYDKKISKIDNEISEMSAEANERDPSTEMVLKATANSWVEIEDVDVQRNMSQFLKKRENLINFLFFFDKL